MTTLEILNITWQRLNGSALKTEITGDVYKKRPVQQAGNTKEDVSLNSLSAPNQQLSETVVNVNIHVPNPELSVNDQQDKSQPDYGRFETLANLAIAALDGYSGQNFYFRFDFQTGPYSEDEINEHYINIRITVFTIKF